MRLLTASLVALASLTSALSLCLAADPAFLAPYEQPGNTPVLWLESGTVRAPWQGDNLSRVIDEQTGRPCLEWYQNPGVSGSAEITLKGLDPAKYDAVRLEWKFAGGGVNFQVQVGGRNWYLTKEKYKPGQWQDTWLDMNLDDDRAGPLLNDQGELVIKLVFSNWAQNRSDEELFRSVRIRDLRLVKFPVRLDCDPKQVTVTSDAKSVSTLYPLTLRNTTNQPQTVQLYLDPARLRHFTPSFQTSRLTLRPRETQSVRLTFSLPAAQAADLPPLYFEEVPVYAMVEGDPLSVTTWYRGYVQWLVGGVNPPRNLERPYLVLKDTKAETKPEQVASWVRQADAALARGPVVYPELRHGYPTAYRCPDHMAEIQLDLVNFKRHYCPTGKHYLEGYKHLDMEAGIRVNSRNSEDCRALGWAYYLTGDEKYAKKAAEILLGYAQRFPGWDYANPGSTGLHSRVGHAILGECWFVHGLVTGYDFVAASPSLTAEQRARIERDFFLLEAEDLQTHRICLNQQCEINAGSGGCALNARNYYLAARVFTGTYGLFDQIDLSFSEDGFSRENEFPYHFAAVGPIVEQGLMYEALGGRFFTPHVKRIFDAPIALAPTGDPGYRTGYAEAYKFFRDPAYLFPTGDIPLQNSELRLAGRTTLRRGTKAQPQYMQIMWGSSTWRGGKDLLNFLTPLNTSITRINYGIKLPWPALSYDTLGGNVPEVDGLTQTGVRTTQDALLGGDLPAAKYLSGGTTALYPGVDLSRVCALVDGTYLVVDRLTSAKPHRYSFSFYPGGEVLATPGLTFAPYEKLAEEGRTYAAYNSPQRAVLAATEDGVSGWTLDYKTSDNKAQARLHVLLDGAGEVIRGTVWNVWNPVQQAGFLTRRTAPVAACVQVLEPGPEYPITDLQLLPLTVEGKAVPLSQGLAVSLTTKSGKYLLIDCDLPGVKSVAGITTTDSLYLQKVG